MIKQRMKKKKYDEYADIHAVFNFNSSFGCAYRVHDDDMMVI